MIHCAQGALTGDVPLGGRWPIRCWGVRISALSLLVLGAGTSAMAADIRTFRGLCDASAAVDAGNGAFWVANDEENTLRLYDPSAGTVPVGTLLMDAFLQVDPDEPEADIEGAATDGDLVFWITSHGRNKDGKKRESRHRFFATRLMPGETRRGLMPVGQPYAHLLRDLNDDPRYAGFRLKAAARRAPKDEGGLNIEALTTATEGAVWIGFRNPIPGGRALLAPLRNSREVVLSGTAARLGAPLLLDLRGLGVRDIARLEEGWLILAGRPDQGGGFRLFRWDGRTDRPDELPLQLPPDFTPEAVLPVSGSAPFQLLLLSDDGSIEVNGCKCKDLKNPMERRFRATWLPLAR